MKNDSLREIMKNVSFYSQNYEGSVEVFIQKIGEELKIFLVSGNNQIDISNQVSITLDTSIKKINDIIREVVDLDHLFLEEEKKEYSYVDIVDLLQEFDKLINEKKISIEEVFNNIEVKKLDPVFFEHYFLFKNSLNTDDVKIIKLAKTPAVRFGLGKSLSYIIHYYK